MIVCVSIGNTNIRCAFGTRENFRQILISAGDISTAEELAGRLEDGFGVCERVDGSIIASVVPEKTALVAKAVAAYTNTTPQLVDAAQCGIDISDYGGGLGQDRIVCAAVALADYPPPLMVLDFGTATTVNVIGEDRVFLGGAILPGVRMGAASLSKNTALLPEADDFSRPRVIGRNTLEGIVSGAVIGAACAAEGYLARVSAVLRRRPAVLVTGGNAPAVLPHCGFDYFYEPDLLVKGLFTLYREEKCL